MWNGKNKAVTFSFDDGVTQDERAIEILNRYGLKATFNINSALLGLPGSLGQGANLTNHTKIISSKVKEMYKEHEVAVHTLVHPNLTTLDEETIIRQVEEDRIKLSELCGYEVVGMAYPCGGVNNDDRVAKIIKENTGVKYARTITSTNNFDLQTNYFRFNPSVYYIDENFEDVVDKFIATDCDKPQLLYIWGHTYEMDMPNIPLTWEDFERICKKLSNIDGVFYGTNKQVLLDK